MIKRGITLLLIAGTICLLGIVVYVIFPWAMLYVGLSVQPNPPTPQTTYGEFPFKLEYDINGKRITVEDTLICQFAGFGVDEGRGKYREWTSRLASGNKCVSLLEMVGTKETDVSASVAAAKDDAISTIVFFDAGSADYYMGESNARGPNFPNASYVIKVDGQIKEEGLLEEPVLLDTYKIRLISWEVTEPIENKFIE